MKNSFLILILIFLISCNTEKPEANFYKNLYTGEILTKKEFEEFTASIYSSHKDSIEKTNVNFMFYKLEKISDSIIQKFKYNLRVGDKYLVRINK